MEDNILSNRNDSERKVYYKHDYFSIADKVALFILKPMNIKSIKSIVMNVVCKFKTNNLNLWKINLFNSW